MSQIITPEEKKVIPIEEMDHAQLMAEYHRLMIENPLFWGKMYLKEHFRKKSPKFHLILLRESMQAHYLAIQAPRGFAKTTILTFLRSIHGLCFKLFRHIVILQNTYEKAVGNLLTIKTELKHNRDLIQMYGIKIIKDSAGESIFEHPDGFKTRILCKGKDQMGSIRGEKFGAYRPDLFLIDDLEDDKMVKNADLRQELKDDFDNVILKAGEERVTRFQVVGTPLHDDSLMADLCAGIIIRSGVNSGLWPFGRTL